jgi:plasmid stabilization system protein ParE
MRIEWSEPAMQDMAALRDYIASDSPARAGQFIERLFDHVDKLEAFPELGRKVPVLHGSRDLDKPDKRPWEAESPVSRSVCLDFSLRCAD